MGSGGFGTDYRYRTDTGQLDGEYLPVDFVKLAEGYGAKTVRATTREEAERAIADMRKHPGTTVVVIEVDKEMRVPGYESWWDVPMSEVSEMESIRRARAAYEDAMKRERHYEIAVREVSGSPRAAGDRKSGDRTLHRRSDASPLR